MRGQTRSRILGVSPTVIGLLSAVLMALPGCAWRRSAQPRPSDPDLQHFQEVSTAIEYPDVDAKDFCQIASTAPPITIGKEAPLEFWDLSLQEAIHIALMNSQVLRDLGGAVIQAPDSVRTIHNPAIQETDPSFGVAAALSAFDAAWSTEAFFEKNDRALNNQFFGGGTRILKQDLLSYSSEIFKRAATGTELTARHNVEYDFNNAPGNNVPNLPWLTNFELEVRQPLLQGAGVSFNRIAGPGAIPGNYNGVLIARVNTDISLAEFENGVRNLVSHTENAYWGLYFAYRDLDARIAARDRALQTWRRVYALYKTGRRGGEAEKEAQAREQYFRFEEDVQNALAGRPEDRTRLASFFRLSGGIYVKERQLRLMLGLPLNDGRLIRPSTEPTLAKVMFRWDEILAEALTRRTELRRQKWTIKRRELELVAAKNFLYPRLDAVGRYRWRGLGHDLIEPNGTGRPRFNDAFQNLFDGDFQEWALGFELTFPIGLRQAHAAVRHAQLNLAREHAILREQEREVTRDLSDAVAEKDRAYKIAQTSLNRRVAAQQQLAALEAVYKDADERQKARLLDLLLDAQRRLADAERGYYRSLTEYMLAIKDVHFNKGSLLDYNEIYLSEGPWPHKAYRDAIRRDRLRIKAWRLDNFVLARPPVVSRGAYPQQMGVGGDYRPAEPPYELIPTPPVEPAGPRDANRRRSQHLRSEPPNEQRIQRGVHRAGPLAPRAVSARGASPPPPLRPRAALGPYQARSANFVHVWCGAFGVRHSCAAFDPKRQRSTALQTRAQRDTSGGALG